MKAALSAGSVTSCATAVRPSSTSASEAIASGTRGEMRARTPCSSTCPGQTLKGPTEPPGSACHDLPIGLSGHVVRELPLVVEPHPERELLIRPEDQTRRPDISR